MDNSHDTLIGALNRAAEWFSESCMKAEATYCLSAIEAAKGKRHMDKPVSEPTAPAEPISPHEQHIRNTAPVCDPAAIWEFSQMAKDAERYRWLRERFKPEYARHTADYWVLNGEAETINDNIDSLDAVIDAAMKG